MRVPQDEERQMEYALTQRRQQFRVAAENAQGGGGQEFVEQEAGHRILIIGEFLSQLEELAKVTNTPITGKTHNSEREQLYQAFRDVSWEDWCCHGGNFAIDLPDADVLIQVSGKYGSRQEEAQRLGRILRPKSDGRSARFYTLVSLRTCEEEFADIDNCS